MSPKLAHILELVVLFSWALIACIVHKTCKHRKPEKDEHEEGGF